MAYLIKNKNNIITITTLAIPVIIENILQTLLGTVDTYFAGQISDNAIAAIGVTNLIMNVFIVFFTAISIGRAFVLIPLMDLNESLIINGKPISYYLSKLSKEEREEVKESSINI